MVTVKGYLPEDYRVVLVANEPRRSEGLDTSTPYRAIYSIADKFASAFVMHQPIDQLGRTMDGWLNFSYFDDYYNRIWFRPTTVDFGAITADTSQSVYIWNSHLHPVTLDTITPPDDNSVFLSGIQEGLTLPALGGASFLAWANISGNPDIDATFNFAFSPFELARLPLIGSRSRLWPYPIDWTNGFETTYEFSTEVITSDNGYEQRRANRQTPRKSFSFDSIVTQKGFRLFLDQMVAWQGRTTIMPEFTRFAHLTEDTIANGDTITLDYIPVWMMDGGLLIFLVKDRVLVRTIDHIDGNVVTFTSNLADGVWIAGTKVYKAVQGHMKFELSGTQHTNRTATIQVEFDAEPGNEVFAPSPAAPTTWNGREVFMKRPNWADAPTPSFNSFTETLDYGKGVLDYFIPINFNMRTHKANYVDRSVEEGQFIEDFFLRSMGQLVEFYMPTWTEDIELGYDVPAASNNLRIVGGSFARDYQNDPVYKDLIIFFNGGGYQMHRVREIYEVTDSRGTDSIITVVEQFVDGFGPDDIRQICWMPLWRLASDQLTTQYLTDEVAQVSLTMQTQEYEEAE